MSLAPSEVLRRMQPVPSLPVYAVGIAEAGVTVASQQRRALHLVDALAHVGVLGAGARLAVIGAGPAGLTGAVRAAKHWGCRVTLLERAAEILPTLRGNATRLVHPNLYRWPEPGFAERWAKLPLLDWEAASAGEVARQIEAGFLQERGRLGQLAVHLGATLSWSWPPERIGERLALTWTSAGDSDGRAGDIRAGEAHTGETHTGSFSAVVLAVGFGPEKRTGVTFPGYWQNDLVEQTPAGAHPLAYLIQGAGDGGLTDLLRVRLSRFDQADLVELILRAGGERAKGLADDVRRLEAQSDARAMDAGYRGLDAAWLDTELCETGFRPHTVVLNDRGPALGPRRFPLNKLLAGRFLRRDDWGVRWIEGELTVPDPPRGEASVVVDLGGGRGSARFDRVLVRIGPGREHAISTFGDAIADGCRDMAKRGRDVAEEPSPGRPAPAPASAARQALLLAVRREASALELVTTLLHHGAPATGAGLGAGAKDPAGTPQVFPTAPGFEAARRDVAARLRRAPPLLLEGCEDTSDAIADFLAGRLDLGLAVTASLHALDHAIGYELAVQLRGRARHPHHRRFRPGALFPRPPARPGESPADDGPLTHLALVPEDLDAALELHVLATRWPKPIAVGVARPFAGSDDLVFHQHRPGECFGVEPRDAEAHARRLAVFATAAAVHPRLDVVLLPEFSLAHDPDYARRLRQSGPFVVAGVGHVRDRHLALHTRVVVFDAGPVTVVKSAPSTYPGGLIEDIHPGPRLVVAVIDADLARTVIIAGEDRGHGPGAERTRLALRPAGVLTVTGPGHIGPFAAVQGPGVQVVPLLP